LPLALHNTLTRKKEPFEPIEPDHVRLYVCGPTVYQRIHVGNARPLIVFDVLFRLLRHLYPSVTYVRNITDVDDKIIAQAKENGEPIEALTTRTTEAFLADAAALGCLEPTLQPKATRHIAEMVALIERLIETGNAYAAEGHVLFHTPSMATYGSLSGRNRDDQIAGARVEVAPYKRDPADFILWKPADDDAPGWDSPWGRGRPGWHIECSAMAEKHLGVPFDIHGGGQDLIFPHHENEMAQSCCAHGIDTMARYWLHNGFVDMRGQKMSKSLGNVLRLDDALAAAPGEAIRLWMLGAHYRAPIDCSEQGFEEAKTQLDRFYGALERAGDGPRAEPDLVIVEALEDDLNTPKAIAVLHDLLGQLNRARHGEAPALAARLKASGALLGLLQQAPQDWLRGTAGAADAAIDALIAERLMARKARNFARADAIRDQLAGDGVILEDGPGGTSWRRS
jgi:cysteinyl-tRNA synthetase